MKPATPQAKNLEMDSKVRQEPSRNTCRWVVPDVELEPDSRVPRKKLSSVPIARSKRSRSGGSVCSRRLPKSPHIEKKSQRNCKWKFTENGANSLSPDDIPTPRTPPTASVVVSKQQGFTWLNFPVAKRVTKVYLKKSPEYPRQKNATKEEVSLEHLHGRKKLESTGNVSDALTTSVVVRSVAAEMKFPNRKKYGDISFTLPPTATRKSCRWQPKSRVLHKDCFLPPELIARYKPDEPEMASVDIPLEEVQTEFIPGTNAESV